MRMKTVITLFMAVLAGAVCSAYCAEPAGQSGAGDDVKAVSAKLIKRIPAGYRIFSEPKTGQTVGGENWILRGDLNGDGADDYVLVIKATDKKNIVRRDESDPKSELVDVNSRGLMIFFKDGDDYKLVLENRQCFESENEDGGVYFPPYMSVDVKKGNIYINYGHGRYGWWQYTFRYKNSDFELIGYDEESFYDRTATSINFPAEKMLKKVCLKDRGEDRCADCCAGYRETWKNNITFKPPTLLRKIKNIDDDYGDFIRDIQKQ